jgi:hypothetical protein
VCARELLVEDFLAIDGDLPRGKKAEADFVAANVHNFDFDIFADDDGLVPLAGEN